MLSLLMVFTAAPLPPVVIVPGDGSNILEARLSKPSVPHWYCSKSSDWYRLWLNTANLLAATSCWADNIRLHVDATTGRARNAPGVETRVPFWGSTEGLEELDPQIPGHATAVFYQMVSALLAAGFVRNSSLRGAPYDFRYTPDSIGLVPRLRALIEQSVAAAAGQPATLVTHSLGGLQTLYFLRQQTAAWKARHISRWVAISTPFAGSAQVVRLFASGDSEGLPVAPSLVRDEQRSYETNHWLFPAAYVGSPWEGVPLVHTNSANYTVADTAAFLDAIGYSVGKKVTPRVRGLLPAPGRGPGVPVLCLYSTGVQTPLSFFYTGADWAKPTATTMGDGDGTVNLQSLQVCKGWGDVRVQTFAGVSHAGMLKDARVIQLVLNASRA